ncbi:MAG: transposase family protein [Bacteroidales bacterium]|nr:transposase family protein [Bacteroidales bacterium]
MTPKILSYFCSMKDPRIERKKLYPLTTDEKVYFQVCYQLTPTNQKRECAGFDKITEQVKGKP